MYFSNSWHFNPSPPLRFRVAADLERSEGAERDADDGEDQLCPADQKENGAVIFLFMFLKT